MALSNSTKSNYNLIVVLIVEKLMARQLSKLTALQVTKLTKPGLYGDGAGLTLQITKAGVKSWLFRFMREGKAFGMGLGATHTVSLAEARQKALEARKLLADGHNPLAEKKQKLLAQALERAKMMTFDQCAKAYIEAHKASWKNAKHIDQWTNTLATYSSPVFGQLPVAEIDTALVVKCLAPIWQTKTETASRLRGRIESVLGWATTSGYRTGENPARWKGHLENLLANISKTSRTKNHPSLPWQQIGDFMAAIKAREGNASRAMAFTILTACRSGEVRGAQWAEFDFKEKVWTIPAKRMKAHREHQVPLSNAALALLASMPQDGEFVFPGSKGQALSDMSLTAVIRRMNNDAVKPVWVDASGEGITVHGFRSTFRMWTAETTAYPREVAEHALAHKLPDMVERAYQRGTQFAKRQSLMAEWGMYCTTAKKDAVGDRVHKKPI
ncbi:tyrosine-type recombinase/integrase [Polaromonas sp. CG_9.7]|uniref:tyrosine-type recombinase/integrase n=1 Tax=unclassified Polaromonas TaxID=2638319 RepID=UPI001A1EEBE0|nr:integrase [Polaromonas sp. CG_9.7]MBG6112658.1 integrase [Polaromonas sp. CG_9.2]